MLTLAHHGPDTLSALWALIYVLPIAAGLARAWFGATADHHDEGGC